MTLVRLRNAIDAGEVSRAALFARTIRAMADLDAVLNFAIPAENRSRP